jgi:predicted amidohydrolase YtcJ
MHHEDKTGSIEVGKQADLVVLDRQLFEIPVTELSDTQVLLTLLDGEVVYTAN